MRVIMNMHNPPHPGEVLQEMYIRPLALSITDAAKGLGITRQSLSELVNGRRNISTEMALRLSKAFSTTAEYWLNMQTQFDLWQYRRRKFSDVTVLIDKAA